MNIHDAYKEAMAVLAHCNRLDPTLMNPSAELDHGMAINKAMLILGRIEDLAILHEEMHKWYDNLLLNFYGETNGEEDGD